MTTSVLLLTSKTSGEPGAPHQAAVRIFQRLLQGFEGAVALRLWDDSLYAPATMPSTFTLVVRDPALLRRLLFKSSPLLLADAYFRGTLDCEGDLYQALSLKNHFQSHQMAWRDKLALLKDAKQLPTHAHEDTGTVARLALRFKKRHSRDSDRAAITFHYDVSNAFYGLWLDSERVYSCAYFHHPHESLDQAQRNKLDLVCRKLRLAPEERLLDIGCGWGALVCWAARYYGVRAHGITLSHEQLAYAQQRIAALGLQDRVTVELRDYRDLSGSGLYDKVSSIGMFEHVGLANLPAYLETVHRLLRPGGLFLNHGITHDEEGWNQTLASAFINRYVFPDGELDRVSNIQLGMERAGFEIHDVEGLRPHYALTLRHWVQRLETHRDEALAEVDETTYRVWRLYMAACALEFESGGTGVYQILASRRDHGAWPLPLTRNDLFYKVTKD